MNNDPALGIPQGDAVAPGPTRSIYPLAPVPFQPAAHEIDVLTSK